MHRKVLAVIIGVIVLSITLSGCGTNTYEAAPAAHESEANTPSDEEHTPNPHADSSINSEASETNDITDHEGYNMDEGVAGHTAPSHEDIGLLLPEGMEIPEGLVLSIPPTQVRVGIPDGADVPLVVMGERLIFDGQGPIMMEGEVFVPIFGIFDYVNPSYPFITTWDGDTVTIRNPHVAVTITETMGGDSTFEHQLTRPFPGFMPIVPSQPAQRINGEFMLPLRPIAEAIGIEFEWVEERGEVHVFIILEGFGLAFQENDGTVISLRPPNPFVD